MEPDDLLADQVVDRGPPVAAALLVLAVADCGQVVDERVVPDVEDVPLVPGHGYAPLHRRAGDGDVLEASPHERQGLVPLRGRPDGVGAFLVPREESLLEARQLEEVILLLHLHDGSAVDGALAADQLLGGVVVLARHAVEAPVHVEADESVVVDPLEKRLHRVVVTRLGRADEVVVRDVEVAPGFEEALDDRVRPLLGRHTVLRGGFGHLRSVLVGTGEEEDLVADQSVPASQGIRVDGGVGVADVRHVVHVVDGRRDVEAGHRP